MSAVPNAEGSLDWSIGDLRRNTRGRLHYQVRGIYAIEHLPSGSVYVGTAVSISARWQHHLFALQQRKHHNRALQRAWDQDGAAAFRFRLLELLPETAELEDMLRAERRWIAALAPLGPLFNIAGNPPGRPRSNPDHPPSQGS